MVDATEAAYAAGAAVLGGLTSMAEAIRDTYDTCQACYGTGSRPEMVECFACDGSGCRPEPMEQ